MNRKGDEGTPVPVIIAALIAIAVLVMVVFGIFYYFPGIKDKFLILIPWYNVSQPPAEIQELLRYDISEDKVEYYTGTAWVGFGGDVIELGDRKIEYGPARYYFADAYYFDSKKRDESLRGIKLQDPSYDAYVSAILDQDTEVLDETLTGSKVLYTYKQEDVIIRLRLKSSLDDGESRGNPNEEIQNLRFILRKDNSLLFQEKMFGETPPIPAEESTFFNFVEPIRDGAIVWRDSIFEKPMKLYFVNQDEPEYFCAQKVRQKFLVIDLKKPVSEDKECLV